MTYSRSSVEGGSSDLGPRALTGKGPKERLKQYITARRSKLRQQDQIERLMGDDNNVIRVKQDEMKSYRKRHEEFIELNQAVNHFMGADEFEVDQTSWFEPKASCCREFMASVEAWADGVELREDLIKDATPMDSVSNPAGFSSRSSRASSHISSAASIQRKEEADRAALIAKAAATWGSLVLRGTTVNTLCLYELSKLLP
ncbi:hypothetical protein JOB18_036335 [Solea senegalensis]|uniref:Uncharacterized protein n=1 Tax=Solea senegalensis TaxID=28829 RepID=A0AAV6R1L4_SOLSE|nr:hypothetical protein JOB18_036335 [Solea senegalensis]